MNQAGPHPGTTAFTGVVLCGGASHRMGRDKALIEINGVPMARRVAAGMWAAGATEVIAVGGDAAALTAIGLVVRPDDWPSAGPLAATITSLRAAVNEVVFVASCDLLRPDAAAFATLVAALGAHPDAHGAIPAAGGRQQWTHAAWRRTALGPLHDAFVRGVRSLHEAAEGLVLVPGIDLASEVVANANEPGDLPDS